jgi:hypothetical protein
MRGGPALLDDRREPVPNERLANDTSAEKQKTLPLAEAFSYQTNDTARAPRPATRIKARNR